MIRQEVNCWKLEIKKIKRSKDLVLLVKHAATGEAAADNALNQAATAAAACRSNHPREETSKSPGEARSHGKRSCCDLPGRL